jgi:hypothetical protein
VGADIRSDTARRGVGVRRESGWCLDGRSVGAGGVSLDGVGLGFMEAGGTLKCLEHHATLLFLRHRGQAGLPKDG